MGMSHAATWFWGHNSLLAKMQGIMYQPALLPQFWWMFWQIEPRWLNFKLLEKKIISWAHFALWLQLLRVFMKSIVKVTAELLNIYIFFKEK